MKRLNWWTIVLLLISQTYATELAKQESDLKVEAKDLLKAAATSAEYSTSLANDYSTSEKQVQDNVASSSSVSTSVDSGNYNQAESQSQYSQPLSYSQPGTPVQPIHSYSQPLNYAPQALPYTAEQTSQQYADSSPSNSGAQSQYQSIKDLPMPEIPAASSNYYPQYPAHQAYNPQMAMQPQASSQVSDYHSVAQPQQNDQQYDSIQPTYVQPAQPQQVYMNSQHHHVNIPGSSYSEQSYVVDNNEKQGAYQPNSYSQPLPPEYSPEYASHVKLVAKNKYSGPNNGGYQSYPDVQPHYSTNVVPAAANLPIVHSNSIDKNNYGYNNDGDKPTFQEKPLYQDKPQYTEKAEEYQKVNHNLNNNLQNGYNGEYEVESGDHYRDPNHGPRYNAGPHKPIYNPGRDVKPLSNYQTNRPHKQSNYGPGPDMSNIYGPPSHHGSEYSSGGPGIEDEISLSPTPDHGGYPVGELEHNHIHGLPPMHKHKISEVYESPVEHMPPPYLPTDLLNGPSLSGSLGGLHGLGNPMDLIYSNPYKLAGRPSGGLGGLGGYASLIGGRSPLMGAASSQSATSTGSASNYGQFLSSLLSAYSLGGLKQSSSKPSSSKGGLASYLNLPGLDLFKGYSSAMSPSSYPSSLLTSASGLNKYYLPNPAASVKQSNKPSYSGYLGWPSELAQPAKPKPSGLLGSSSNIVSSIDELFKSSLNPTSKRRPLYSDATRAITNLYKKLLN